MDGGGGVGESVEPLGSFRGLWVCCGGGCFFLYFSQLARRFLNLWGFWVGESYSSMVLWVCACVFWILRHTPFIGWLKRKPTTITPSVGA